MLNNVSWKRCCCFAPSSHALQRKCSTIWLADRLPSVWQPQHVTRQSADWLLQVSVVGLSNISEQPLHVKQTWHYDLNQHSAFSFILGHVLGILLDILQMYHSTVEQGRSKKHFAKQNCPSGKLQHPNAANKVLEVLIMQDPLKKPCWHSGVPSSNMRKEYCRFLSIFYII